jgi:hypothetical protein
MLSRPPAGGPLGKRGHCGIIRPHSTMRRLHVVDLEDRAAGWRTGPRAGPRSRSSARIGNSSWPGSNKRSGASNPRRSPHRAGNRPDTRRGAPLPEVAQEADSTARGQVRPTTARLRRNGTRAREWRPTVLSSWGSPLSAPMVLSSVAVAVPWRPMAHLLVAAHTSRRTALLLEGRRSSVRTAPTSAAGVV